MAITIKKIFTALAMVLIINPSFSQSVDQKPNNSTVRGDGEATQKDFTFNAGLGLQNPKIFTSDGTQLGAFTQNFVMGRGQVEDITISIDQGLGALNPFLRWDSIISQWTFSNDGVNATPIGVVVSNGVNTNSAFGFNDNPNGESGTSGWSYSGGGTFASLSSDPLEGVSSLTVVGGLVSEFIQGPLLNIDRSLFRGRTCEASIDYIGGVDGVLFRVLDLSGAIVAERIIDSHEFSGPESLAFQCPDTAEIAANSNLSQVRISIETPVTGNLSFFAFDRAYLGTLRSSLGQVTTGSSESYVTRICTFRDGVFAINQPLTFGDSCSSWITGSAVAPGNRTELSIEAGVFPNNDIHCSGTRVEEDPNAIGALSGAAVFNELTNTRIRFGFNNTSGGVFVDGGSIKCTGRL